MFEALFIVGAIVGACAFAFAILAGIADYLIPALARRPWRPARRAQATYRRRS